MAKTFSIDRILHGDEPTEDAESSDGLKPVTAQKSSVDFSHPDLELMSQMAAAAYYPGASLLAWPPVQSPEVPRWYHQQQGKQLPAAQSQHQPIELHSLAAVHQQQQAAAAAAMFAPNNTGFPFGWIPAVNPSDFGFFHGT